MSNHKEPIVPHILFIAEQRHPWHLAGLGRYETHYHTPTTVRVGAKGAEQTMQQHHVYCIADDAAWGRVLYTHSALQTDLNALADGLRKLGSYASRLAEAGGMKLAPNPLCTTVISAPDPDTSDEGSWFTNRLVPQITKRPITGHTPKMLRGPGHWAPDSEMTWHARDYFVCPDDAAWAQIEALIAAAEARARAWEQLLRELGTYQAALADGRYARKETPMATSWPAPSRPLRAASSWGQTDIDSDLVGKLQAAGYHWEMAKQTPDGRWHHVVSSRNTALLRNDQVLLRRERLEALLAPATALATTEPPMMGVPMMDQAEARETLDAMRSDLGQIELSLSSFRQRALDFADRQGWKALGYAGAAEAINAELGTQYSKSYLSRLLQAAEIERVIELPIGNSVPESQLRPLASLDAPDQQRQAWQAATAATNGKPTAKAVEQAVQEIKPKPLPQLDPADSGLVRHPDLAAIRGRLERHGWHIQPHHGANGSLWLVRVDGSHQSKNRPNWAAVVAFADELDGITPAQPATAPFWQSLSANHPTAHFWTRAGANYRAACGLLANVAPAGSADGGHCSSCVRASWGQQPTVSDQHAQSMAAALEGEFGIPVEVVEQQETPPPATITISTNQGPREIVPLLTNGTLAMHLVQGSLDKAITHIASGKRVASFARHPSAGQAFNRLAALDWSQIPPDGGMPPAMALQVARVLVQFDDVDHYELRLAKLRELEAAQPAPALPAIDAPAPSAWQERQSIITPAQQAESAWYDQAEVLAMKVLEYADHGSRHAAVTIALELASYLAGDDLPSLAEQLGDAEYEALAAYRRDRSVPTLESEGIHG